MNPSGLRISHLKVPRLKTLEWDILNPDRLNNLEINNKMRTSVIKLRLKIKTKSGSSINLDIHHLKVPSSAQINDFLYNLFTLLFYILVLPN